MWAHLFLKIVCLLLDANHTAAPLNRAEKGSHPAGRFNSQKNNCKMPIFNSN